jgi:molybdate-binding protein
MLRLAGSDDPALDIVLRMTDADQVATVGARGSFHGLTAIWRGTADAAAIHLRHRSGIANSPFARTLLRGLLTPEGSRVTDVGGLRGLRVARRGFGTGTRVLLDRLLADAGIGSVAGPEADSHLGVAMAIASGQADAGLGVRAAEPMIAALRDPAVQSSVHALSGYDLCDAGAVRLLA